MDRFWAWAVHLYTGLGLVAAAILAACIVGGSDQELTLAFLIMVGATFVDASDGWLARRFRVKEVVPEFDGRRLDDIIDFLNYTFLPVLLMWRVELLPPEWAPLYFIPLLSSIYGFCQADAKTADGFFLGFPSYWNVISLYLFYLGADSGVAAGVILGFSALTFVPTRYLYPSQGGRLNQLTCVLGLVWAVALVVFLAGELHGEGQGGFLYASLLFPLYYLGASWFLEARFRIRT